MYEIIKTAIMLSRLSYGNLNRFHVYHAVVSDQSDSDKHIYTCQSMWLESATVNVLKNAAASSTSRIMWVRSPD